MDSLTPDFDKLPDPRNAAYTRAVVNWLAGTYSAGWGSLKQATMSGAIAAGHGTSTILGTWQRIRDKRTAPAEADFLMDLNYDSAIFGPSLGTVVLAAFAIESFVRLGYVVALEQRRSRQARAKGRDQILDTELAKFDGASTQTLLSLLRKVAGYKYRKEIEDPLKVLFAYRNSVAHDSPVVMLRSGQPEPAYPRSRQPKALDPFERLHESRRPVRVKQVIASIRAHDNFVSHAIAAATRKGWTSQVTALGSPFLTISEAIPGHRWWSQLRAVSEAWETGPQDRQATDQEFYNFRLAVARRTKVQLVDDT